MSPLRNRELLALLGHPAVQPDDKVILSLDGTEQLIGTVSHLRDRDAAATESWLDDWVLNPNHSVNVVRGSTQLRMSDSP